MNTIRNRISPRLPTASSQWIAREDAGDAHYLNLLTALTIFTLNKLEDS